MLAELTRKSQVQNFRSPLDFQNMDLPPDLRVVMNTVTVEKQD
jgi:hypothetical protein